MEDIPITSNSGSTFSTSTSNPAYRPVHGLTVAQMDLPGAKESKAFFKMFKDVMQNSKSNAWVKLRSVLD